MFDCSSGSSFEPAEDEKVGPDSLSEEEEEAPRKKPKTAARAARPARAAEVEPMRRSSKPQVAHLRLMGRQKVAWRMHQMRREIFRLAGLLKRTREDLELATSKFRDANWALHELSNGAGHPAVQLYRAGELIDRIPYHKRDRIGLLVWRAAAAMKSSQSVSRD